MDNYNLFIPSDMKVAVKFIIRIENTTNDEGKTLHNYEVMLNDGYLTSTYENILKVNDLKDLNEVLRKVRKYPMEEYKRLKNHKKKSLKDDGVDN